MYYFLEVEEIICDENFIKKFITNSMSYKIFTSKLKTQQCPRRIAYHESHHNCILVDEIFYMITEYVARLIYDNAFDNTFNDAGEFVHILSYWVMENQERSSAESIIFTIVQSRNVEFRHRVINFFVYFLICKVRSSNDHEYHTRAVEIYDRLIKKITKTYIIQMAKKIAIDKIKRNKIYNLGLGLKLSVKAFNKM